MERISVLTEPMGAGHHLPRRLGEVIRQCLFPSNLPPRLSQARNGRNRILKVYRSLLGNGKCCTQVATISIRRRQWRPPRSRVSSSNDPTITNDRMSILQAFEVMEIGSSGFYMLYSSCFGYEMSKRKFRT